MKSHGQRNFAGHSLWGHKSDMNERRHIHNLTSSFVCSFVSGHLGSFHVLAIINSAAMNVRVYLSFQIRVCIFSGHMPRSGVGGSCTCLVTQSCLTLWDPLDYSLPGFSVHRISRARILKWVAISSLRGSSQPRDWTHVSCVSCIAGRLFILWAIEEDHWIIW